MTDNPVKEVRTKWYLKPITVIIAILAIGPLAIPLVWMSPGFKVWHKIVITSSVILLTLLFARAAFTLYQQLLNQLQDLL